MTRRVVSFRLEATDWQALRERARAAGITPGTYARLAALGQAERIELERQIQSVASKLDFLSAHVTAESDRATNAVFEKRLKPTLDHVAKRLLDELLAEIRKK